MNEFLTALTPILVSLIGLIVSFLGKAIFETFKDKNEFHMIVSIIEASVLACEQESKRLGLKGAEKFNHARSYVLNALNERGLTISDNDLKLWVEKFVKEMKGEGYESEPKTNS